MNLAQYTPCVLLWILWAKGEVAIWKKVPLSVQEPQREQDNEMRIFVSALH